jgi:adenine C2-methylase RlmN of 23S rRNA A2503 and tRNA A37
MATKKEKQLATILLKERIERLTGKKVVLEVKTSEIEKHLQKTMNTVSVALLDFMNVAYMGTPEEGHRNMTNLVNALNKVLDYDGVGLRVIEVPV